MLLVRTYWIGIKELHPGMQHSFKHVVMKDFGSIHTQEAKQNGTAKAEDGSSESRGCIDSNPFIVGQCSTSSRVVSKSTHERVRFHHTKAIGPVHMVKLQY